MFISVNVYFNVSNKITIWWFLVLVSYNKPLKVRDCTDIKIYVFFVFHRQSKVMQVWKNVIINQASPWKVAKNVLLLNCIWVTLRTHQTCFSVFVNLNEYLLSNVPFSLRAGSFTWNIWIIINILGDCEVSLGCL